MQHNNANCVDTYQWLGCVPCTFPFLCPRPLHFFMPPSPHSCPACDVKFIIDKVVYNCLCAVTVTVCVQIPALLISALGNKHGSAPDASLCIARALLNFARLPDLRPSLLAAGCVEALEVCVRLSLSSLLVWLEWERVQARLARIREHS